MSQRRSDRREPDRPRAAQRALARDLPADRRELSGDRRAGRLAQPLPAHPDDAVAGLGAQRDVRPRAARADLCAAHLGRPAADRARPALLRRRADGDRRPARRPTGASIEAQVAARGQIIRRRAQRGLRHALRPHARGRRGAQRQVERAAQAHRVRAARARARAGRAGRPRTARSRTAFSTCRRDCRPRRSPRRPISSMRACAADAGRGQGGARARHGGRPRRARSIDAKDHRGRVCELVGRRAATTAS